MADLTHEFSNAISFAHSVYDRDMGQLSAAEMHAARAYVAKRAASGSMMTVMFDARDGSAILLVEVGDGDHAASASREGVSDSAIACALIEAGRALVTFDAAMAWPISLNAAPVAEAGGRLH
jgi:hypothetical protein